MMKLAINPDGSTFSYEELKRIVEQVERWGFDFNLYNVRDLESFLKAVLQQPRSVTSDFNFPKWHYYGRGSGGNAQRHEYEERH